MLHVVSPHCLSHHRYASLIISLMAKDCRYLLDTVLYNPELYKGACLKKYETGNLVSKPTLHPYVNYLFSILHQHEIKTYF